MVKRIFSVMVFALGAFCVNAQSVKETSALFNKQDVSAYTIDYNVSKSDLLKVADKYFSENLKGKKSKASGFIQYKGVAWDKMPFEKGDIYYKVEGTKKASSIILLVSKGYDNFVNSGTDPQVTAALSMVAPELKSEIDAFKLNSKIVEQEKKIKKLEKDYKSKSKIERKIEKNNKKLSKKIEKNNSKIESNKKKYESIIVEIDKQKQILDDLKNQK